MDLDTVFTPHDEPGTSDESTLAQGTERFYSMRYSKNPMGLVDAFSLPEAEGWHPVLVPYGKCDPSSSAFY